MAVEGEYLLWYDDDPVRDLAQKVGRAARRYRQKFGGAPDVCFVHPSTLVGITGDLKIDGVRVAPLPTVLPHHFWLGQDQAEDKNKQRTRELADKIAGLLEQEYRLVDGKWYLFSLGRPQRPLTDSEVEHARSRGLIPQEVDHG